MNRNILIDTHCHLGEYKNINHILESLVELNIIVVAMTEAPSVFHKLHTRLNGHRHVRVALGMHPLIVAKFPELEWQLFTRFLPLTSYIGEIGLDFSSQGVSTRQKQEQAFRRVLQIVAGKGKILSLHSRRAEKEVLEYIQEFNVGPAIFHWYSGPFQVLDQLLDKGHYCSINPAMIVSKTSQKLLQRIPPSRILIETDGPYTKIENRHVQPSDVPVIYKYLVDLWQWPIQKVVDQIYANFKSLIQSQRDVQVDLY